MNRLLLTTALTALLAAPAALSGAAAQEREDAERRGVSPQEYFGDRDAAEDEGEDGQDRDAAAQRDGDGELTVTITGVERDGGTLYVALQDEDGFARKGGAYTQTAEPDGRSVRVTFEGVTEGEYAVAVFQDADGDGDLRLGSTGPTEPWGLSGGTPRRSAPSFDDAMVMVEGNTTARVRLIDGRPGEAAASGRRAAVDADDDQDSMERRAADRAEDDRQTARRSADAAGLTAAERVRRAGQTTDATDDRDDDAAMATRRRMADRAMRDEDDRSDQEATSRVTVTVTGVQPDGGAVFVALQEQDGFAQKDGAYTQTSEADGRSVRVTFDGVEAGDYAVAAFQDTDGDEDLSLGNAGPTEPWGFSGRVARDRAPAFDDASIRVDGTTRARVRLSGGTPAADAPPQRADDAATQTTDETADADMMMPEPVRRADARRANGTDAEMGDEMRGAPMMDRPVPTTRENADVDRRIGTPMSGESALLYRRSATLSPTALTARDYLGAELVNADGDEVAEVEDVILNEDGQAIGVVLATGGLFGIGQDFFAVDFNRVRAEREDDEVRLVSALSEEDVERLREFDLDAFKERMGSRLLASQVAGAEVRLGETRRSARVEDVVMTASGRVEGVVLSYDDNRYLAPFGDITRDGDRLTLTGGEAALGQLSRFESRREARRTVRERVLGDRD